MPQFSLIRTASSLLLFTAVGLALKPGPAPAWAQATDAPPLTIAQADMPALGVVRSRENEAQWNHISDRLRASGVSYRVIELENLETTTDLAAVQVLFLPNIEVITVDQFNRLERWVNRGGRLITSGPVGNLSAPDVRQRLRSLLGAYWAFPLAEPAQLAQVANPAYAWVRSGATDQTVQWGGVVLPAQALSHPVALWTDVEPGRDTTHLFADQRAAAIVANERAVVLGWRWGLGSAEAIVFDAQWFQAALSHYQGTPPVQPESLRSDRAAANNPAPAATLLPAPRSPVIPSPATTAAVPPARELALPTRPSSPRSASPSAIATGSDTAIDQPPANPSPANPPLAAQPPVSAAPATSANRPPAIAPPARVRIAPTQPALSTGGSRPNPGVDFTDPADQVAPPGLNVSPSSLPINAYDAVLMRQELENLMGRYERTLFAIQAQGLPTDALMTAGVLAASAEGADSPNFATPPALQAADRLLQDWNGLIEQRDYETARQRWLDVQQNLWNTFPDDQRFAPAEVRAVWLDRGTIVAARSPQGLARVFDRLAAAGFNTVFLETVNAGYPVYPSRIAPAQNPLTRGWDPLAAAVELANERNMELHAWIWTFAAGNQAHNQILNQPASYPGPLIAAHPTWANYDNAGRMIPPGQGKPFLDPANPEVRTYLLRLIDEIVSNYDVDGLQLDYIRYPFQDPSADRTYGYGQAARQQFRQRTGVDPITLSPRDQPEMTPMERDRQRQLWQQWTDFRIEQVSSFVGEVSDLLERHDESLVLSTAVFAHSEHERLQKIQQHWEDWARRGDVDMIVLMSYALDTNRFERLTRPWLVEQDLNPALILPGIRLLNLPNEVAFDQIQTLRDLPAGGYAVFAAENLNSTLHQTLSVTQGGEVAMTEPIPYRQPFHTAAARYDALLQEWVWLLQNDRMTVSGITAEQWIDEAQRLQAALQALADRPSARTLQAARARLSQLQSRFNLVRVDSISHRYHVQVWDSRFAAIADLLAYGEQQVIGSSRVADERSR